MHERAIELVETLGLSPHLEGGYYKKTFRSESTVVSPANNAIRNAVTDIYFLLVKGQVSRFHKVLHDEIWHFYEGAPIELVEIRPDNLGVKKVQLSRKGGIPVYKHCVKGGNWQSAYSTGEYSLAGCTLAPGFDFSDFEFLKDNKDCLKAVLGEHPELEHLI